MDITLSAYINALIGFLFCADILLNKGMCLVHESGRLLGRGTKSRLLHRKFAGCSEHQPVVTQGLDEA